MRAIVIINGYPVAEKFHKQGERIAHALRARGVETDVLKNGDVSALLQSDGSVKAILPHNYDFAVYLDKDKYLGYALEKTGLRLFNSARAVEICDDKMTTYLSLINSGLRIPKTLPAPLSYNLKTKEVNERFLQNVAQELGFPLVAKTSYGSFGVGVELVHGMSELREIAEKLRNKPHFFQEYVAQSKGRDIRVIVIGGKALGGMERMAQGEEFRSNIELGGKGRKITLTQEYAEAAERAATALGLDYCGVDLLITQLGPVLCEVNSNAFFEGFEEATGLDVADAYAEYILSKIKQNG